MGQTTDQDPLWPDEPTTAVEIVEARPFCGTFREGFYRVLPALGSLRALTLADWGRDALAGLTVATVAVPQAMAYATIAGLPPQIGLYTAIIVTVFGALFSSSKQLINGPTNAISIAALSALTVVPEEERMNAAIVLAFLVGIVQLGITLLRLGDLTRYISHAVIVGFTLGASILLVLDQLKNLLGLHGQVDSTAPFVKRFWQTMTTGGPVNGLTLALGLGTIAFVMCLRWFNTWLSRRAIRFFIPEFLAATILMAGVVWWYGLNDQGVAVVGSIPAALPTFKVPSHILPLTQKLSESAVAIALLGLLEAVSMAKFIASQTKEKLDINQLCLSEGVANLSGSFFQCMPGSGSLTRSAINQHAGAVSQWSAVISAAAVALIVLLFAPAAQYIPRSALAGLLILTGFRMVDRQQLRYQLRATRFDAGVLLVTAFSAVFISVEFCIFIGVLSSFVLYIPRAAGAHITEFTLTPQGIVRERVPEDPPCDRVLLYNLEGELFFGSAPSLEVHLASIEKRVVEETRILILRVKRVRNPDAVCLHLLDSFIKHLDARGVTVLLAGVRLDLARALRATGLEDHLGAERIFPEAASTMSSTLAALKHAYDLLVDETCPECPRRQRPAQQNGQCPTTLMSQADGNQLYP
jgi:SulP family sulfate permease